MTLKCPKCGSPETRTENGQTVLNIRGFKVHMNGAWWSHCLVCAGYYDGAPSKDPTKKGGSDKYDERKG